MTAGAPPGADLRGWLEFLRRDGRLMLARPGVDLRFGVAAVANRLDGRAAVVFPAPGGHSLPVVAGLLTRRAWMAEAMGVAEEELTARYQHACDHPVPWAETGEAPGRQVVHRDVDLEALLPIPTHNEYDHGAYVTAGLLITRDAATGAQNVAIHRLQVSGPDRLGALLLPRHTHALFAERESAGEDLPVAIVVGVDPLTLMASQAVVARGRDELAVSGALRGGPLPVVRCLTNDVRVPADAEIVIEGRLRAGAREPEGPFGEFSRYYGERAARHVIEVDVVTHRHAPIYHTIVAGGMEHLLLGGMPREAGLASRLRDVFPCVRAVHLSPGGVRRYHLHVQVECPAPGEARDVILAALAMPGEVKQVTVVDADVDVYDPAEVEWAVATRFQADRDLVVVPRTRASALDPSAEDGLGAKMGLDATVPPGRSTVPAHKMRFTRTRVPGEEDQEMDALVTPAPRDWRLRIAR